MQKIAIALALPIGLMCGAAHGLQCGEGGIQASPSASAPPDENVQCIVLGRIFCMVEEYRYKDEPQTAAIDRVVDWLGRIGQTPVTKSRIK